MRAGIVADWPEGNPFVRIGHGNRDTGMEFSPVAGKTGEMWSYQGGHEVSDGSLTLPSPKAREGGADSGGEEVSNTCRPGLLQERGMDASEAKKRRNQ